MSGLQIFPAESGGQLRSAGLIRQIANAGIEVDVYAMIGRKKDYLARRRSETVDVGPGIREHVNRNWIFAGLQYPSYWLGLPPLWITTRLNMRIPCVLKRLAAGADAMIVDFPFLHPAAKAAPKGARVVLNTHNVEADLWPKPGVKRRVARLEETAVRAVDAVVCCAPGDQDHFAAMVGREKTLYVPNGIDVARFENLAKYRAALRAKLGFTDDTRVLLFPASSFGPNVEGLEFLRAFVEREAALVAQKRLHFLVVGSVAKKPFKLPGLTVTSVVETIEPYFAAADFAFNAVLRGSGTNVKMCEFMAARLPILTSEAGTRGFQLTDGQDCVTFRAETLADVIAKTRLFDDEVLQAKMVASAYERNKIEIDMRHGIAPLVQYLRSPRGIHQ